LELAIQAQPSGAFTLTLPVFKEVLKVIAVEERERVQVCPGGGGGGE
jgi:hypothetical protein